MKERKYVFLWSIFAAMLLCVEMVLASLAPFARENGTPFLSEGMYSNLVMAGGCYLVPLFLYSRGVGSMKYVIAVVNGIWIICQPVIIGIALQWIWNGVCVLLVAVAVAAMVVELVWYVMCRRRRL